jgi:uncharacterized protein UPF0547
LLEELKERLAIPLAVVAVLGFVFGLPFGGVMVGFSALFFAYIVIYIPLVPILWWQLGEDRSWRWLGFLIVTFGLAVAVIISAIPEVEHDDLAQLTASSVGGMSIALAFVVISTVSLQRGYKENHKNCPECMNTVLAGARICQHCGYRWEPPLSAAS